MRKIAVALLLGLSLAGCAGPSEPPPTSIYPLDKAKVTAAEMNIRTDPELAGAGIKCQAENDTLVLNGQVGSDAAKKRAEDLAKRTEGIKKIANHIQVVPTAGAPSTPIF